MKDLDKEFDQMIALLKDNSDDLASLEYVKWTFSMSRGQIPDGMLAIVEKHKSTPAIAPIIPFLMRGKEGSPAKVLFDWARSSSPHKEVQAMAAFSKTMDRGISPEDKKAELEFVQENGGDLVYRNRKIAVVAATSLYADEKGVIRYKNARGEAMDEAVNVLLKEMGVEVEATTALH